MTGTIGFKKIVFTPSEQNLIIQMCDSWAGSESPVTRRLIKSIERKINEVTKWKQKLLVRIFWLYLTQESIKG